MTIEQRAFYFPIKGNKAEIDKALHAADESCGVSVAAFVKLNRILKGDSNES